MHYVLYFDVAAILLTGMLILMMLLRNNYPSRSCHWYKLLLWFNLVSAVSDLISAIGIMYPETLPIAVNYIMSAVYLFAHNMTAVAFFIYTLVLVRGNTGLYWEKILWKTVIAVDAALILTSPFTGLIFSFDEAGVYHHGSLIAVLYAIAFFMLAYAFILFIRHRNVMSTFQIVADDTFILLLVAAILFQVFYPEYLVEAFCCSLALLLLGDAFDNPAIFLWRNSSCFNQTAFNTTVGERIAKKTPFTVLAFTYDDFAFNQKKYGDEAAIRVLNGTVRIAHSVFGRSHVFHTKHGCFAVILDPNTDVDATVEKLGRRLERGVQVGEETVQLRAHFCVLHFPGFSNTAVDINESIEKMLYTVFEQTGERLIRENADVLAAHHREEQIIHALRAALRRGGFEVFYQPILESESGRFRSCEALLRLKNQPSGGKYVGPDEFIPIAEKSGMILEIGDLVFDSVCRFVREERLESLGIEYVEVNLSMVQLLDDKTPDRFAAILTKYGLTPSLFNLEITETSGVDAADHLHMLRMVGELRERGFHFSLDDYGSGYSTVNYLASIPFDLVKIDKALLWNAMKDPMYDAALTSTIALVRNMGKECVVEGVENEEMVAYLKRLGAGFFQGYLYSRPIDGRSLVAFLTEKNGRA